jgi:hypothetical protein
VLKEIFIKTSQGEEKEKKTKEKIARTVKGDLGKYSREKRQDKRERGRETHTGLVVNQDQSRGRLRSARGLSGRSRSKSE